ncbi:DUF479 domain-containing protein [Candidatus Acetothermia bacterium]|nr:DUF479 domain-containing protein [Candidatus Acetothermia bacterium]
MNYLAHALLAQERDGWVVGSLIADFRPRPKDLPIEILQGIVLHQKIDGIAERSSHFHEIRAALRPAAGLYAGVVADICCDNLLIDQWQRYSQLPLEKFTAHVYTCLHASKDLLPVYWRRSDHEPHEDWLASYQTREGLERAMLRVRAKVSSTRRFPKIDEVLNLYVQKQKSLSLPFIKFFDELFESLPGIKETL